ncbi:hypothetical protein [Neolewinella antarctica]|uniref:Uncharacterized protein n=1 Tax=Neolewinella antarctica TaxID=442734 RepID=A0ABX0XG01_9BACT|nr:hypothetical protein [Neolewinella antarctica]NJC28070.1 hypothetical protein [Neolewinella antarctica]
MYVFKTFLLLILCSLTATGQAQDNPKFDLTRWHVKPGQQQALIDALEKVDGKYAAASNRGWDFYRYEDNTLEVITPIRDYAELDRLEAQFDFARASITDEEAKAIYDPASVAQIVTGTESMLIEKHLDMSYTPAGEEGMEGKMNALRLDRFVYDFANTPKIFEHGKKLVDMMRKAGSPVHMNFVTMDYGDGQTFEVEYLGTDRADLDRRLAEAEKLLAGPEMEAWGKTATEISKRVSSTFGTKVTTLGREAKPPTNQLFVVANEQLLPGKEANYEATNEAANQLLRAGNADLYWTTSIQDNGMARHFIPIQQMSDIDRVYEQMRKRNYQLTPAQMKKTMASFDGQKSSSHLSVMRNHVDYAFLSDKIDVTSATPVYKIQAFDYKPEDGKKVMAFLEKTKTMLTEAGGGSPYQVWSYDMGGPDNRVFVVDYGKDKASVDAAIDADMKKMGKDLDGWMQELTSLLTEVEVTYGRTSAAASYWPEAKVK